MLKVTIGNQTFVTRDDIAHSIAKYAGVLERKAETATIQIPAVGPDGEEVTVTCHLGTTPVSLGDARGEGAASEQAAAELKKRGASRASTHVVGPATSAACDPYDI